MPETKIEWADDAINFLMWNCHKVSPGCKYCYAEARSKVHPKNSAGMEFLGNPQLREAAYAELRTTKPGKVIFVNTHSDTFHKNIPLAWTKRMFAHMQQRPDLIFLLLTKRPEVALEHAPYLQWPDNIWLGTSIESPAYLHRAATLAQTPAKHRFISFEPLLEHIPPFEAHVALQGVEWAIVGGESGEKFRPFNKVWAQSIHTACIWGGVPFFFKQGGGFFPGMDRELDGSTWDEQPPQFEALRRDHAPFVAEQGRLF